MTATPSAPDPTFDPPALTRADLRNAALVHALGGTRVVNASHRAGRIFDSVEDLIAAGHERHAAQRSAGDVFDPPALTRRELRDPQRVVELGGSAVLDAARRAGRIFGTVEELVAAGYDVETRRQAPAEAPLPPAA